MRRPRARQCCQGTALPFRPRAAPWLGSPAVVRLAILPSVLPPRGDLPVTAAAQNPRLQRGDKLPSSGSPGRQLAAGFPTSPLAALAGRAFSAALQPPVTGAQQSPRILSNKAGARRRPGERLGLAAGRSEPWQDIHAPVSAARRGGRDQTTRGEESVLLRERKPPGLLNLLAQLPLPERSLHSQWDWAGRRVKRCGPTLWPDGPAAPLPLSRVSGWTTVNVAMSAVGAEVTLGFSISNGL